MQNDKDFVPPPARERPRRARDGQEPAMARNSTMRSFLWSFIAIAVVVLVALEVSNRSPSSSGTLVAPSHGSTGLDSKSLPGTVEPKVFSKRERALELAEESPGEIAHSEKPGGDHGSILVSWRTADDVQPTRLDLVAIPLESDGPDRSKAHFHPLEAASEGIARLDLAPGGWLISILSKGWACRPVHVELDPGGTEQCSIELVRSRPLTGRVVDGDDWTGIAGAHLDFAFSGGLVETNADDTGWFELEGIPCDGKVYQVYVKANGYAGEILRAKFDESSDKWIQFDLDRTSAGRTFRGTSERRSMSIPGNELIVRLPRTRRIFGQLGLGMESAEISLAGLLEIAPGAFSPLHADVQQDRTTTFISSGLHPEAVYMLSVESRVSAPLRLWIEPGPEDLDIGTIEAVVPASVEGTLGLGWQGEHRLEMVFRAPARKGFPVPLLKKVQIVRPGESFRFRPMGAGTHELSIHDANGKPVRVVSMQLVEGEQKLLGEL